MEQNYEVLNYSIATLKRLFNQYSEADPKIIESKLHSVYFEEYFGKIGAKTIIVEKNYIDRDFLEDYASYYVNPTSPHFKIDKILLSYFCWIYNSYSSLKSFMGHYRF